LKLTKVTFFIIFFIFTANLLASISDSEVSTCDGEKLQWEDGAYGYFVMFKSNLEIDSESGETCVNETTGTTYTLDSTHVPQDALIERAFLVWSGAVPSADLNEPTDNEVTIKYNSADAQITLEETITAKKAYKTSEDGGFEFQGFRDLDNPNHSYFTYRADITDFFKEIHEKGRIIGIEYDGYSLYGDYNLSGLTCASNSSYVEASEMLSGWSIVLVYISEEITPRNIYLYHEFAPRQYEMIDMYVKGFEFPKDPKIKITMATHLGDPELFEMEHPEGEMAPPELIQVQGDQFGYLWLTNECNPQSIAPLGYIETFNSISSVYGWYDKEPTCVSTEPSMDVDTFVIDSSKDTDISNQFSKGGAYIGVQIGANEDKYTTNYMIVETDTKAPTFDIPGRAELVACTPASEKRKWCHTRLPYTFAIRIQNWGENYSEEAKLRVQLPEGMTYILESTMMATRFSANTDNLIGQDWKKIDDIEGEFPLKNEFQIADKLLYCDRSGDYLTGCQDTFLVKFETQINSATPFTDVFEIKAYINDSSGKEYITNRGFPIVLRYSSSKCAQEQNEIDLSNCGGRNFPDTCTSDADCEQFKCCLIEPGDFEGTCIYDPCPVYDDDDNFDNDSYDNPDEDPISEKTDENNLIVVDPDGCGCSII